jgi:hypothetical protein
MEPLANGELNLDLQLHYGEIHAKAPSRAIHVAPCRSREIKGVTTSASPWLSTSSTMIGIHSIPHVKRIRVAFLFEIGRWTTMTKFMQSCCA